MSEFIEFNQDRLSKIHQAKMHMEDRILVVKPIDGEKPLSSRGLLDSRLFQGTNTVHAIRENETGLWKVKFQQGVVPPPLKQHFTSLGTLLTFTRNYFANRNLEIVEVKDNYAAEQS